MNLPRKSRNPIYVLTGAILALGSLAGISRADEAQNINNSAYQTPIQIASKLQVTGTAEKLSLDADHADVQSALKAILKQAGKQFQPDANVTGQVTLLLTDQPLDTVLRAICEQTYLRYQRDPSDGIYRFTRDDEAIKAAFTRLNALNARLRQQLRDMGFEVPDDNRLLADVKSQAGVAGRMDSLAEKKESKDTLEKSDFAKSKAGEPGPAGPAGATVPLRSASGRGGAALPQADKSGFGGVRDPSATPNIHSNFVDQGTVDQYIGNNRSFGMNAQDYQQFLRKNSLVGFNIPAEKPAPVADVLMQFSQQANVPIFIDQSVPNSLRFRIWGSLAPRPLAEALNILAPVAHLQWRWVGNTVFVFPTPDFQVTFGDLNLPNNTIRSQFYIPSLTRPQDSPPPGNNQLKKRAP